MKNFLISIFMLLVFSVSAYAVKVFPNPWIPDSKTSTNKHGTIGDGIKFEGLSNAGGTIYIYNATGELVRSVTWSDDSKAKWDGKNDRGEFVASGVYIWVIKDGGTKSGKIVIIR